MVTDHEAVIHAFWKHHHEHLVYSVDLIPYDSTVLSERVELEFHINGVPHRLQFGSWVAGEFQRLFGVHQPAINGEGTSPVMLHRPDGRHWIIKTPPGATGRLWNVQNSANPIDRGLYTFSFEIRLDESDASANRP